MTSTGGSQQSTPKKDLRKTKQFDSFQDFQDKTNDAWDDGDDDLILMANVKMSLKDVQNTAMQVVTWCQVFFLEEGAKLYTKLCSFLLIKFV